MIQPRLLSARIPRKGTFTVSLLAASGLLACSSGSGSPSADASGSTVAGSASGASASGNSASGNNASGGGDPTPADDTQAGGSTSDTASSDFTETEYPTGLGGVVVLDYDAMVKACVPLCAEATEPDGDDWSFEAALGGSCIIPSTPTGANQGCVTGEAIPEPLSVPGVVVVEAGERACAPLCVLTLDPAQDDNDDGWSWENNESCVIPGSASASNQACMTHDTVPEPEARPGIILVQDVDPECVPLCQVASAPNDSTNEPDWAFEDNESCVLPGTATTEGKRDCTFTQYPPDFTPPALAGDKVAPGFYTEGGKLYDAYGAAFIIRGINNAHIWYDGYGEYRAWHALDNIASYGTNTVRIVWETTGGSPILLADILHRTVELGMVPMIELHDSTGDRAADSLLMTAEYYTQPEVIEVLQKFREYLLINIANEWSGGEVYQETYQTAITNLRAAGLQHTLVIDASGFGQNMQSLFDSAEGLTASDPEANLLFSIHMYDLFADAARVETDLTDAVARAMPLIVGEFGPSLSGTQVAWQQIVTSCNDLGLGYIAWSWTGNDGDTAHLDMAEDWEGPLTTWGDDILNGTGGIAETSEPASIFQSL